MNIWKRTQPALLGGEPVRRRPWPQWPAGGREEERRLLRVLREGRWQHPAGGEVSLFERRFAGARGVRHAFAVAGHATALRLALLAAGLERGAKVILPAYGPLNLVSAVLGTGLRPVFADVGLETGNADLATVDAVAEEEVRGVLVFHTAGLPVSMEPLLERAHERGWIVWEDASHAHAGMYRDRPCGTWGRAGVFSLCADTVVPGGEAGVVITGDGEWAARCRTLLGRDGPGGQGAGEWPETWEAMSLGEFAGAVLNAQLDRFELTARRRDQRSRYLAERLASVPGVHPQPRTDGCTRHGCGGFLMRLDADRFGAPRDAVVAALAAEGIPCGVGWRESLPDRWLRWSRKLSDVGLAAVCADAVPGRGCVNARRLCRQAIWLESRLLLADQQEMDDIVRALEKLHEHGRALKDWWRRHTAAEQGRHASEGMDTRSETVPDRSDHGCSRGRA
ncbi:DegT/DnrJ/EryC1/StrS family aminotransferase [Limisphaera sp. 4302-co]|uniref:DegT/DnrJ/EryC1/StrS family aminotransferase n=1 Tax=Limisphaera sp. 4302-co TaxID=3400417 RepID=UPI003C1C24EA